jgi:hypothetical protein
VGRPHQLGGGNSVSHFRRTSGHHYGKGHKSQRIADPAKVAHVRSELAALRQEWAAVPPSKELDGLAGELRAVNEALWEAEDALRVCEREKDFGARFVELARSVYRTNDRRGFLKRRVDGLLGARVREQKVYPDYMSGGTPRRC